MIAMPVSKYIESATFKSIYDLARPANTIIEFHYFQGYGVDQARNHIARCAIEGQFSHVFFVDADIVLPPDALLKLLAHDKDVVSGLYGRKRIGSNVVEVFNWNPNARNGVSTLQLKQLMPPGLHKVAAVGLGCCLIKTGVFKRMQYPMFEYFYPEDPTMTISEDIVFCQNVYDNKMVVFVDSSVVCGHIGSYTFSPTEALTAKPSGV